MNININTVEDKLLTYGLALLAVSITISISLMTVATGLLVLAIVIKVFKKDITFKKTGLEIPLLLFIAAYSISALFSASPGNALKGVMDNYWYILNMYIIVYLCKRKDISRFLKILAAASVVMGIYALIQAFTGWPLLGGLSGKIFGIKMGDTVIEKVTSIIFMGRQIPIYMGTGVLSHHLTFGGQILMLSFLSYGVLKKRWKSLFVIGGLVVSFAYSAWLGFITGIIFMLLFKKKRIKYAVAFFILTVILFISVPGNVAKIKGKLEGRIAIWTVSSKIYKASPLLGVGSGQYTRVFKKDYLDDFKGPTSGSSCHPHSIYLSMLVGGGALTFLAFLFFIYKFIKLYIRPPDSLENTKWRLIYTLLWASLFAIAVAGFFQTYLTDAENSVLIWTIAGMIVKLKLIYSEKPL
jgi:O-antigen ligase